jgi:hydrogenase nickel incorporation protein HypA/HybF
VHELSIAQSIIDIVHQHVPQAMLENVRIVRILVGEGSGVVADSLSFSLQAITADTLLANARMNIETIPFRISCASCSMISDSDGGLCICPSCGSGNTTVISGTELRVKDIELVDEEHV